MPLHDWLQKVSSTQTPVRDRGRRRGLPPKATLRLTLEILDDRIVPSLVGASSYPVAPASDAVVKGDFNGDGKLDLATVDRDLHSTVSVTLGKGDGTFQPALNAGSAGEFANSMAVGDFNGDGKLDLATANDDNFVNVLLGNGDGTFQPPISNWTDLGPSSIAVGDFNGDGKLDLGVASNGYVDYMGYSYYHCGVDILLGNGDGSFSVDGGNDLGFGYVTSTTVGDFNGDGRDDFVAFDSINGNGYVFYGDPTRVESYSEFSVPGWYFDRTMPLAAGDLNADGHADLLSSDAVGNVVTVMLNDGSGILNPAGSYASGNVPISVVLGDFSGDGKLDVAAVDPSSNIATVLTGNGDGTFSAPDEIALSSYPFAIVTGDFNGDGQLDAATLSSDTISVLVNDGSWPSPGMPRIRVSDATVTEGNTGSVNASFTLSLSVPSSQLVTVHYATADGTATAGSDYVAASGDVTFAPGQTSATVTVPVLGDRLVEPIETFAINLSGATNAIISDGQGIGTILDDEPRVTIGDATVAEGNAGTRGAIFTVTLSASYDVPVTIHYATANGTAKAGSDYQAASGTLTIPAGKASGTITVQVIGDRLAEANETFVVNLSGPNYGVISDGQGMGTILDDEPRISISDVTMSEGKKGQATSFTFTVTLSAAYDQAVTMSFKTTDGTATKGDKDYVAQSGTITFKPGETTKTVTIMVNGDSKKESDEYFFLDLSGNSSNSLFIKNYGIGTILNDD